MVRHQAHQFVDVSMCVLISGLASQHNLHTHKVCVRVRVCVGTEYSAKTSTMKLLPNRAFVQGHQDGEDRWSCPPQKKSNPSFMDYMHYAHGNMYFNSDWEPLFNCIPQRKIAIDIQYL